MLASTSSLEITAVCRSSLSSRIPSSAAVTGEGGHMPCGSGGHPKESRSRLPPQQQHDPPSHASSAALRSTYGPEFLLPSKDDSVLPQAASLLTASSSTTQIQLGGMHTIPSGSEFNLDSEEERTKLLERCNTVRDI